MPLVIHPRIRKAVGRVAAMTCVAVFASTGAAFAACQTQPVSTPFAQWGDTSSYFLVPGGSFEGTATQVGWSLSNAELTTGNEPYRVDGPSDDQSLTIDAGGSATSPTFCVDSSMRSLRFFAHQTGSGGNLQVQAVIRSGRREIVWPLGVIKDGSMPAWAPIQAISLQSGLLPGGLRIPAALRFVSPGGSWQVDDVYVDPFRLG